MAPDIGPKGIEADNGWADAPPPEARACPPAWTHRRRWRGAITAALRPFVPRGLLARALLIILVPLVVTQGIALQIFYGTHLDVISRRLAGGVAGDVGMVVELFSRYPVQEDRGWIFREAAWRLDLSLAFEQGATLGRSTSRSASLPLLPLEGDLDNALRERLRMPFDTDWQSDPRSVIIRVALPDGVLHVEAPRKRLFASTLYLFVIWLVGASLLLFVVAALFMKNQVRALRRLAAAAEAFGKGRETGPIKPEGASEVRQAAAAFNGMRANIRRFVTQRTEMLAGISHDLRTPLTRLRLGLAMLPAEAQEDAAAMTQDVEEMERMVASYLAFARGEVLEAPEPTDLVGLVREIASRSAADGSAVAVEAPPSLTLPLRPDAVRRCLGNLLDNARRHAAHVTVTVRPIPGWAEVAVDDDGPGIPAAAREGAFKPFASFSAGGTGLGLAIARDIARAHGGEIALGESAMGGLRATIRLPM
ncbi:HAMP domain-containing protein [Roseomonas sp. SSH11]|uniref:histidine kinase n=1 Tax=Pararoseomonas baculiformis TaxID=2820812 RepID=A0ABS4AKR2_9PROT|nr:ATP-binding protein [Pararoseomonas baculiformis]MBP0447083.1 HAMP domain-containing protein [Pararoseomonas baculiformis]